MNSEAAGTEWTRKAAREIIDSLVMGCTIAGLPTNHSYRAKVEEALAEVIARNVQPSPELADVLKELDYRGIRFDAELAKEGAAWECAAEPEPQYFETLREALDFLFSLVEKEARPVPQPATPNEELDKLRAKAARKSGDVIWLEGVLRKYGRHLSTCVKDKTYDVPCSCAWDNLALSINLPSPVIGVPQPATEPTKEFVPSNFCNRHSDCAAAVENFKRNNSGKTPGFNFHCHDEDCEDCFGC